MPKRTDIRSILIIGTGPIVIGQACEFDYSGTQACKALREEGFRVVLVNSNPATIMTDPEMADATYIEPITVPMLEKIIEANLPKRGAASWGPGPASGWYWTLKSPSERFSKPSVVPSYRFTWVVRVPAAGRESISTLNP